MVDHALTYRSHSLRHWHHRARLRQLIREVENFDDASSIADIGCSNGYITNVLSHVCRGQVQGFDYLPELIEEARTLYPHIDFRRADLNWKIKWKRSFDLVCCFETLEHVGDLDSALRNVMAAVRPGGVLIISVPVETGLWGIAKYCAKVLARYPFDEITAGRGEYFRALISGNDLSRFRKKRYTWGTHFGFDWRDLEESVSAGMRIQKAYTKYATRIIVAQKTGDAPPITNEGRSSPLKSRFETDE